MGGFRRGVVAVVIAVLALAGTPAVARAATTPDLSLNGPGTAPAGAALTLTGRITADAPAGVAVSVVETNEPDGPATARLRALPAVTTAADGTFTVTVTPLTPGHLTYRATATVAATAVTGSATVTATGASAYLWGATVRATSSRPYTARATLHEYLGSPIGGVSVHVRKWVGRTGTETGLPDQVTGPDGGLEFTGTEPGTTTVRYTLTWDGDGTHATATGTVQVSVTRAPTTLTATATGFPARFSQPVTISGVLDVNGDPILNRRLTVTRSYNGTPTELPSVPVAADGTYTLTDVPAQVGQVIYTVAYPGDTDHGAASKQVYGTVLPLDSAITVQLAAGQTPVWGRSITVTGRITLEAPGSPSSAGLVLYTRGTCGNYYEFHGTVAADGTYSASVMPSCPTDLVVQALYGDAGHAHAEAATPSAPVGKAPATVTVRVDGSSNLTTDWLRATRISAEVWWGIGRGRMDVYAQPLGKPRTLVKSLTLTDGIEASFTYYPEVRTTFTFVWSGDAGTAPSTTTRVVLVRPYLHQNLEFASRRSGAWLVFSTKTNPLATAFLTPAHGGQAMRFVVDQNVNGTWRRSTVRVVRLDRYGTAAVRLTGKHVKGTRFRIQAYWAGDTANAAQVTGWIYYRFA